MRVNRPVSLSLCMYVYGRLVSGCCGIENTSCRSYGPGQHGYGAKAREKMGAGEDLEKGQGGVEKVGGEGSVDNRTK